MESNKRLEYGSNSPREQRPGVHLSASGTLFNAELNMFFPFDPYTLPKSNSYIQGIYREWSSVAIGDDDDDDDDEEDEEDEERVAEEVYVREDVLHRRCLDIHRTISEDDKGLTTSLDAMSISPIRVL
jgi:RNA polymerase I-specific transcription initiation factor RRN3